MTDDRAFHHPKHRAISLDVGQTLTVLPSFLIMTEHKQNTFTTSGALGQQNLPTEQHKQIPDGPSPSCRH
jgi:hypothetical protein